jgi:Uma2 family endonuclease
MTKTAKAVLQTSAPRRIPMRAGATITLMENKEPFGPESNGILMSAEEFDAAEPEDFQEGWCFEIINGVLIVTPIPLLNETDPNEELGYLLRRYQDDHPQGSALDFTGSERIIKTGMNRRRADRVIWAGLGRLPRRGDVPTIIAEFVSSRKRDRERDYETKRDDYIAIKVKEYWIIDRFMHTMTVFSRSRGRYRMGVLTKDEVYTTDLLPGFELPLAQLFALADRWDDNQPD